MELAIALLGVLGVFAGLPVLLGLMLVMVVEYSVALKHSREPGASATAASDG